MVWFSWALVAVLAVLDWSAVATRRHALESVAKPATMLALIAAGVALGAADTTQGRWLVGALALGLLGDVLLLGDTEPRFLAGLAAFLLGHLAYVVAFTLRLDRPTWAVIGVAVFAAALVPGWRILRAAQRQGGAGLAGPVAAYILVFAAMVCAAWATGRPLAGLGATVFLASDTMLALDRFVTPRRGAHLAVMVTYHLGQVLIVVGMLAT